MWKWIRSAFEDADGIPDEARICAVSMVFVFLGLSIIAVIYTHKFDALNWGGGAAALSGGIGAWFYGRSKDTTADQGAATSTSSTSITSTTTDKAEGN